MTQEELEKKWAAVLDLDPSKIPKNRKTVAVVLPPPNLDAYKDKKDDDAV